MMAETYLLQALQAGFQSVQQNPSYLDDILTALNANEMASAKSWFANLNLGVAPVPNKSRLVIAPGFPMAPEQLPFIGVTVADEEQIAEQTGIGLAYYTDVATNTEYRGARFNGMLKATIYTPNADLIIWLSSVCKWSLLSQYDWFGSDAGGAMNLIRIRLGDYEPSPGFLPIFTFARGVFLIAEYDQVFTAQPTPINSATITGSYSAQDIQVNV